MVNTALLSLTYLKNLNLCHGARSYCDAPESWRVPSADTVDDACWCASRLLHCTASQAEPLCATCAKCPANDNNLCNTCSRCSHHVQHAQHVQPLYVTCDQTLDRCNSQGMKLGHDGVLLNYIFA